MKTELPPTDGLALRAADLVPGRHDLAGQLSRLLSIPSPALTCSGTAALVIALRVLQQRTPQRQRVIVTAWSCPLVPLTASACPGIEFVLCDLLPDSLDLDPVMLASLCAEQPPLAIVVTHLAGRLSAIDPVLDIARRCDAWVIEDAAQALGAKVAGHSVGLQGDIGLFSLAFGKGLTCCEGGVLFSRDSGLHAQLTAQVNADLPVKWGWEIKRCIELLGYAALYTPRGLRWIYGMQLHKALRRGDLIAAVGDDFTAEDIPLHRLGHWRRGVAARASVRLPEYWRSGAARAQQRIARLTALPGVQVMNDAPGVQGVWPVLLVLLPHQAQRDAALEELWGAGLGVTRLFVRALADYPAVAPWVSAPSGIDNARDLAARSLTITNSPWLDDAAFERVVNCLAHHLEPDSTPYPAPPAAAD